MNQPLAPRLVAALLNAQAERRSGTFVVHVGSGPTRLAFVRGELLLCGDVSVAFEAALGCIVASGARWCFEDGVEIDALTRGRPTPLEPLLREAGRMTGAGGRPTTTKTSAGAAAPSAARPALGSATATQVFAASALRRLHEGVRNRMRASTPDPNRLHDGAVRGSGSGPQASSSWLGTERASPGAYAGVATPTRTVVVVEDDESTRALLARALSLSFMVQQAATGLDALALLGRIPTPSLILLDVGLPGVDGVTVARKVKAQPSLKDVPVVFLTARCAPADVSQGIAAGAKQYLTKPFSVAELLRAVDRLAR